MKRAGILFLWVTLLCISGVALDIEGFTPDRIVPYKTVGEATLNLHVFTPDDHQSTDRRAAIVFFFGGGWKGGSPSQFYPHCDYLASRGMVAITAEYRVESRHGTTPKACVEDGKSALHWIRSSAEALGVDPLRIAAGGGSAGGHVAAAVGNVDGFIAHENADLRPNALVLFNPVFDNSPEGYGYDRVKTYWQQISPMHNLDKNSPPTIVFLGTNDSLIPVSAAERYQAKMEANGRRCEVHLYEGRKHGFFNYRGDKKDYWDTVNKMDAFLVSLGYLEKE